MKKLEGYSPLSLDVQDRVFRAWESYRETFGLEGEELFKLITAGETIESIEAKLGANKLLRDQLLPLWEKEWLTQES